MKKKKKKVVNSYLELEVIEKLKQMCKEQDRTLTNLASKLIRIGVRRWEKKKNSGDGIK